jgi:hypothetical protein
MPNPGGAPVMNPVNQIRQDFIGYSTFKPGGASPYISRVIPYEQPNFPDELFCISVPTVEPDKCPEADDKGITETWDSNGVASYNEAVVKVNYSTLSYNVMTDAQLLAFNNANGNPGSTGESLLQRYVTIDLQESTRGERIPALSALKFTDGGDVVDNVAIVYLTEGLLTIIWHQIPLAAIPWDAILSTIGTTNNASFGRASPNNSYVFPAETLVMLTPKFRLPYRMTGPSPAASWATDITYRFKYFPYGANSFYHWKTSLFVIATRTGIVDNTRFYKIGPYGPLFWS